MHPSLAAVRTSNKAKVPPQRGSTASRVELCSNNGMSRFDLREQTFPKRQMPHVKADSDSSEQQGQKR